MIKKLSLLALSSLIVSACSENPNNQMQLNDQQTGVIGGTKVSSGDRIAKTTVGLYDAKTSSLCSGTIIAPQLILTAAHCVDENSDQLVVVFAQDFDQIKKNKNVARKTIKAIQHKDYNPKAIEDTYDVALVRFEGSLPAGFAIAPLLTNFKNVTKNSNVTVAGYGLNWSWGVRTGAGTLRTTQLKVSRPLYGKTEIMLDQSLRRGICSGDSGGPMYVEVNGKLHLAGVASRGDSLPTRLTPDCFILSVFSRVDAHLDWIQKTSDVLMSIK